MDEIGSEEIEVLLTRLDPDVPVPQYAHPGDAGADLTARVGVRIPPLSRAVVPTGVAIALPAGFVGLVHPRSGLARHRGVTLLNTPGTIDAGYRGEISVIVYNANAADTVDICAGERVAQLLIQRVARARFIDVAALPGSTRGADGFGSTGAFGVGEAAPTTAERTR